MTSEVIEDNIRSPSYLKIHFFRCIFCLESDLIFGMNYKQDANFHDMNFDP